MEGVLSGWFLSFTIKSVFCISWNLLLLCLHKRRICIFFYLFNGCQVLARFRFFGLRCSFLCTCCWCVGFTSLNCLCGKAEEDISSPSSVPVSLICLTWFFPETFASSFPMSCFRLFTFHFFERSLVFSPSVSSPLHLCASIPPLSDVPSFCHSLSLSSSSVFPPPSLLPQRHLSSISVFSPPSMCLQPFSHPTSNQTYSACWWSSNGPEVEFYLSMHEAPSLHIVLFTPHFQLTTPLFSQRNLFFGCWTHGTGITMA